MDESRSLTLPLGGLLIEDALGERTMGLETSPEAEYRGVQSGVARDRIRRGMDIITRIFLVLLGDVDSPEDLWLPT